MFAMVLNTPLVRNGRTTGKVQFLIFSFLLTSKILSVNTLPRTSSFPLSCTDVEISPKNFLTFSFNSLALLVSNFKHTKCQCQIIELEPRLPLKKSAFSCQILYKTQVMRTSLLEMLDLPNFSHMTTSTISFDSRDKILLVM